jgi:hypothetical protein
MIAAEVRETSGVGAGLRVQLTVHRPVCREH